MTRLLVHRTPCIAQANEMMQALAKQTSQPLDEVRRVYESQFEQLDKQARIKIYLPILAARHAREILLGA